MNPRINKTLVCLLMAGGAAQLGAVSKRVYPPARIESIQDTRWGVTLNDPYRWLEKQSSPEVQTWVQAEDQLAQAHVNAFPDRVALTRRFKELYRVDLMGVPSKRGSRLFYTHRQADQQKPVLYWRNIHEVHEHVVLDPNTTDYQATATLGEWVPSPDGSRIAYLLKPQSSDEAVLHVRDTVTQQEQAFDVIPGANYADLTWTPDSRGFYYTRLPPVGAVPDAERVAAAEVRFHALGSNPEEDPVIYPKTGDASVYLTSHLSFDGRWLFVTAARGWTSDSICVRDLQQSTTAFQTLFISTSATATVHAWKNKFYVTTYETSRWGQVFKVDPSRMDRQLWKVIVPERAHVVIEDSEIVGGHLMLRTLQNVSSHLEIHALDGSLLRDVPLPQIGSVEQLRGRENDNVFYYQFESFFIPPRIYQVTGAFGKSILFAQAKIPVDVSRYKVDRVSFKSKDKTPVSMFVIKRKTSTRNHPAPMVMIGYGGFRESMLPRFNPGIYPWLESGGSVAIPHLRGGGEYGEAWHRAGMLDQKQHTFDDMIGAAEFLIQEGYTRKDLLTLQGASNGGLLAGVMMTQRPDLFRAIICKNPLLDMVRYASFGEGKAWVPEYGSPDRADDFRTLAAYSPYHHVIRGTRYPAVLFLSAENDDRVDPMHARKMAASLQAASVSDRPVLFRLLKQSGHGGAAWAEAQVEEATDRLSFLLQEVNRRYQPASAAPK